jgi:glutamine cyclotransferase
MVVSVSEMTYQNLECSRRYQARKGPNSPANGGGTGGDQLRFHQLTVVQRMPHPGRGFTQGLLLDGGTVWESTGGYGESSLCHYTLGADRAGGCSALPPELFGEGICRAGSYLWQLTWRERVALRWNLHYPEQPRAVPYNREGWGICNAGDHILTSDGSTELVRRDPQTLRPLGVVLVRYGGERVSGLNDLEWAGGRVWANVWGKPYLLGIDPRSGEVADLIDARTVLERHNDADAVLNGVAALPAAGEFLLTGKLWRSLYHVRLAEGRPPRQLAKLLAA